MGFPWWRGRCTEQRLNRVLLVKEMKLALWVNESESGFVTLEEVETQVREQMDSEEGKAVRDRVKAVSEGAREAMSEGRSSRVVLADRVELTHMVAIWLGWLKKNN
ncbi:hypothetical protein RHMOL_Rhmol03G0219500 [Rhododendron molle]|uniref:Uncharacterized protein n=1 Tax=Rhododendron molle TaxID=49168 RepID=A0ACC0PII4_RHOML|nr:hypothetical protein RHMOL_Rhmol03G0219500 [Rhododendron molle]